jgi:hypothetical protein
MPLRALSRSMAIPGLHTVDDRRRLCLAMAREGVLRRTDRASIAVNEIRALPIKENERKGNGCSYGDERERDGGHRERGS